MIDVSSLPCYTDGMTTNHVPIMIPGLFMAHYNTETQQIDAWTFTPHGSDAGYFGKPAIEMSTDITLLAADEPTLDVEDTDGPFWRAVQAVMAGAGETAVPGDGAFRVEWREDGPHADGSQD